MNNKTKMDTLQQSYDNQLPPDTSEQDEYYDVLCDMLNEYGYVWDDTIGHIEYSDIYEYIEMFETRWTSADELKRINEWEELRKYFGKRMIEHKLTNQ